MADINDIFDDKEDWEMVRRMGRPARVADRPADTTPTPATDALTQTAKAIACAYWRARGLQPAGIKSDAELWKWLDEEKEWLAAARAIPAPVPVVPEGWKLVPVEPTPEMIDAGHREYEKAMLGNRRNVTAAFLRRWKAMLSAAPAPAQPVPDVSAMERNARSQLDSALDKIDRRNKPRGDSARPAQDAPALEEARRHLKRIIAKDIELSDYICHGGEPSIADLQQLIDHARRAYDALAAQPASTGEG